MNNLTKKLGEVYDPFGAIIAYKSNVDTSYYLEFRKIKNGEFQSAKPLTQNEIGNLLENVRRSSKQIVRGLHGKIPSNLLYCSTDVVNVKLVWYRPPEKRRLFFKQSLNMPNGEIYVPGMIYYVYDQSLFVYAYKGKKPEKLIGRIIELCTNEGDLVLDFFAGSGTTGGAAMKMGRQFILVDQMDYTETTTRQRLINTINGDSHGISKTYNWQGGGSFVYCKLAELNEKFITRIEKCNTCEESVAILEEILNTGYVNDNADFREIHKSMDEFKLLPLDDQKALMCKLVDKNMLYVNLSDMEDSEFDITDEEKNFNRSFYKQK